MSSNLSQSAREVLTRTTPGRAGSSGFGCGATRTLHSELSRAGVAVLSTGSFSLVLEHEHDDRVVKLTARPDACVAYYDWCAKAPEEIARYLPMVFSREWINGIHVAVIEKLSSLPGGFDPDPEFLQVYGYVKYARPKWCGWDTHYEGGPSNTMWRESNRTPVLTDPWYSYEVPAECWNPGVLP
jgi:hypothetical protein